MNFLIYSFGPWIFREIMSIRVPTFKISIHRSIWKFVFTKYLIWLCIVPSGRQHTTDMLFRVIAHLFVLFCRRTVWALPLCAWKQVISWKNDCNWTYHSVFLAYSRSRKWVSIFQCYGKVGCFTRFFVLSHVTLMIKPSECCLIISLQRFIDYIGELLQAYVDRREQVCLQFTSPSLAPLQFQLAQFAKWSSFSLKHWRWIFHINLHLCKMLWFTIYHNLFNGRAWASRGRAETNIAWSRPNLACMKSILGSGRALI